MPLEKSVGFGGVRCGLVGFGGQAGQNPQIFASSVALSQGVERNGTKSFHFGTAHRSTRATKPDRPPHFLTRSLSVGFGMPSVAFGYPLQPS
jgi:hypothetical protein